MAQHRLIVTGTAARLRRVATLALLGGFAACALPAGAATFAAQQILTVGKGPHAVAVADLNADGQADIVIVNQTDDNISVLLNTTAPGAATPTFAAQQTFTVGNAPVAVAVADLNGDGKPDIAVVNTLDKTVSILLNTTAAGAATATFATQQTLAVGTYPFSIAAADLDADGKIDLVVANVASSSLSVLRNTTAAGASSTTFDAQQVLPGGKEPSSIVLGDINGDGKPDIVFASYGENNASVLLNTTSAAGAPTFSDRTTFDTGAAPSYVAIGDVNADGKPDIVSVNAFDYTLSVLVNGTGPGATTPVFAAPQMVTTGIGPTSIMIADVDGDGKPDLVAAIQSATNASVFANTTATGATAPTFGAAQNFTTGNDPVAVAVSDVNGDGRPDLVVANFQDNTVSLLLNSTSFPGINPNQHGITGSWFNAATPGQGLELELYPNFPADGEGVLFGGWFTWAGTAADGQRWYALQGTVTSTNSIAQLGIFAGYGGNFAAGPAITPTQVGSATLRFTDCTNGVLTYAFNDGRRGSIPITRLTANISCGAGGDNGAAAGSYLLSGSWYDPSTSGQGLVFDLNPAQGVFFAGWYTYAPDGAQTGGAAAERWYVLQAPLQSGSATLTDVPIYSSSGGVFNDATATTSAQVGTATITFQSCTATTLAYTFTSGVNSGLTGTLNLTRTGPVPAGCSL